MPLIHLLVNLLIIGIAVLGGLLLPRNRPGLWIGVGASFIAGAVFACLSVRPDLFAALVPTPHAVFYSNLYPAAVALFVPCAIRLSRQRSQSLRIAVLCVPLAAAAVWNYGWFFRSPADARPTNQVDSDGICRQTSLDTCSAAAGVTFLRMHGIEANESDVAQLALTKRNLGTRPLGLYRAMQLLGATHAVEMRICRASADSLVSGKTPAIITVGLPRKIRSPEEAELAKRYQWTPGVMHTVVLLGLSPDEAGRVAIAEPDFGLEYWPLEHLRTLHQGFAIVANNKG
jgi:hypothetical protein